MTSRICESASRAGSGHLRHASSAVAAAACRQAQQRSSDWAAWLEELLYKFKLPNSKYTMEK